MKNENSDLIEINGVLYERRARPKNKTLGELEREEAAKQEESAKTEPSHQTVGDLAAQVKLLHSGLSAEIRQAFTMILGLAQNLDACSKKIGEVDGFVRASQADTWDALCDELEGRVTQDAARLDTLTGEVEALAHRLLAVENRETQTITLAEMPESLAIPAEDGPKLGVDVEPLESPEELYLAARRPLKSHKED